MVCPCSVLLFIYCCAQKQGQTQAEPLSILLCSCDLWLWKAAHWLPGSHPKSLVKHLHSSRTHPAEKWAKDSKSAQCHIENAVKICLQGAGWASFGSFGAFHCNNSLEDEQRSELPEIHMFQLWWTPGMPDWSGRGNRGQVSTKLPLEREFYYTVASQEIFHQSIQDGSPGTGRAQLWAEQMTPGRPHRMCKPGTDARCVWEGGAQEHAILH